MALFFGSLVGLSLGLTGGGGSILAVPLLLYGLGLAFRDAVMVSLAVVGLTAVYGSVVQRNKVDWMAGAVLGAGGILGAPVGAWLGARMPQTVSLLLFAGLMLIIGLRMWRGKDDAFHPAIRCRRHPDGRLHSGWSCAGKMAVAGVLTGVLSGMFGVGGGFLVVPALLAVAALPIERALATSLVGISLVSASAFFANFVMTPSLPVEPAAWFLGGAALGMTAGVRIKDFLPTLALRRIFAAMIVCVAVWVVWKNTSM